MGLINPQSSLCPWCQKKLPPEDYKEVGKTLSCPSCGVSFRVEEKITLYRVGRLIR